jgi:hypothetical protein
MARRDKWRTIHIDERDKKKIKRIASEGKQEITISGLVRLHLASVVERIRDGEYCPYQMMVSVGAGKKEGRGEIEVRPKGDITWEKIEKAAERVNKDRNLLREKIKRGGGSVRAMDLKRRCTWATIIRATSREIAMKKEKGNVISKNMKYRAKELREKYEGK